MRPSLHTTFLCRQLFGCGLLTAHAAAALDMPVSVAGLREALTALRALEGLRAEMQAHVVNASVQLAEARLTELAHQDLVVAPRLGVDLRHLLQSLHQARLHLLVGVPLTLSGAGGMRWHHLHGSRQLAALLA